MKVDDSYGNASTSNYISKEDAVRVGLEKAGVTESQVQNLQVEYDCEDGIIIYEVEFTAGGQEYEYDIISETGEILSYESEADDGDDDGDRDDDDHDDDDDDDDDDHDDHDHDDDHDDDD